MKAKKILFAVLTIASVTLFNACSDDPCEGVTCNGHGTPTEVLETCSCDCDTGWSGDNCEDEDMCETGTLVCLNGGTCANNACNCAAGYEGDSCETLSRTRFIGDFTADDNCTGSDYSVEIIASSVSGADDRIVLKGFGKYLCNGQAPDVVATVEETTLTIASQTFCTGNEFTIDEGTGIISSDEITINLTYKTTFNAPQETCTVTLTRL